MPPGQATDLARRADIILSICPPHAALPVAREVDAAAFTGVFVDANAISPSTRPPGGGGRRGSRGQLRGRRDHRVPPGPGGGSQQYLSGPAAGLVAALFAGTRWTPG